MLNKNISFYYENKSYRETQVIVHCRNIKDKLRIILKLSNIMRSKDIKCDLRVT